MRSFLILIYMIAWFGLGYIFGVIMAFKSPQWHYDHIVATENIPNPFVKETD